MQNNPVGWFEIYVDDIQRAKTFYEAVFGLKLTPLGPPSTEIQILAFPMDMTSVGAAGSLVKIVGFPAGRNSVIVYFKSTDCSIEEAKISANGGRIEKPKMSIGQYGFISLGIDSEGNTIGIHSMK